MSVSVQSAMGFRMHYPWLSQSCRPHTESEIEQSMTGHPHRYSQEFKNRVVDEVLEVGKPKAQVARDHGVSIGSVKNWVKKYGEVNKVQPSSNCAELPASAPVAESFTESANEKSVREMELERELQKIREELAFIRKVASYIARGSQ